MKKALFFVQMTIISIGCVFIGSAYAQDYSSPDAFGKEVAKILTKSGSYATCSLEGREVDDAIRAISANYNGRFDTKLSVHPYGSDSSSMKACLSINVK